MGKSGIRALVILSIAGLLAACASGPPAPSWLFGPTIGPATQAPSAESGTTSPTPTGSPAATPDASIPISTVFTSWTRHDLPIAAPGIYGGNLALDVAWFRDRYVAVGTVAAGCCDGGFSNDIRALAWTSPDGMTWELVPGSDEFDLGSMNAVAASETAIVAVGDVVEDRIDPTTGGPIRTGAAWVSTDGLTWVAALDVPVFSDVVAMPDGFLAPTGDGTSPEIWRSPDGRVWSRVADEDDLGLGEIRAMMAIDGGYVAVGAMDPVDLDPASTEPARPVAWRSSDGLRWTRSPEQLAFEAGRMSSVARVGDRIVAVGTSDSAFGAIVWTSNDGTHWKRVVDPVLIADQAIAEWFANAVVGTPAGFLFVGSSDTRVGQFAWTSSDGSSWARVPITPEQAGIPGARPEIFSLMLGDGDIVIGMGTRADEAGGRGPAAWLIR